MYKCNKKEVNTPDGVGKCVTYPLALVKSCNSENLCQGGGSEGYKMEVSRGIWDSAQTLIHYTGETTMNKLHDMMDEKKRWNHKAHYSRQHIFMPDESPS